MYVTASWGCRGHRPTWGHFEQARDECRPAGLVTGAEAGSIVSVEVFVEEYEIPPVEILTVQAVRAMNRPPAIFARQEDVGQSAGQLTRNIPQAEVTA